MSRVTKTGPDVDTSGCFFISTIQATYEEMVKAFGQPETDWEKSHYKWRIEFADGTTATVYDWTRFKEQGQPWDGAPGMPYAWHIGGKSSLTASLVHQAFREAHGLLAKHA